MKIRPDSLCGRLKSAGQLDEFFSWLDAENPDYKEMMRWLKKQGIPTSVGAVNNLITYHMGVWKTEQSIKAADEMELALPADTDQITRERIKALKFDLCMAQLSSKQQMQLLKLQLSERELDIKTANLRDTGVQALMDEADGNERAKAALAEFLAALDEAKTG